MTPEQEKLIEILKQHYETAHQLRCHLIESGVEANALPPQTPPDNPPGGGNQHP